MSQKIVISGIGTDVGKTVVSAILAEAFEAAYWKPIQAGDLDHTDSMKIANWCSEKVQIIPERFRLKTPCSPHLAAELDGVFIQQSDLEIPDSAKALIIEGAGGLLVPINTDGLLYADVIKFWDLEVILVSKHYLGSINHTLLSLELLEKYNIPLKALIWIGAANKGSEEIILKRFPNLLTYRIPLADHLDEQFIREQATQLKSSPIHV